MTGKPKILLYQPVASPESRNVARAPLPLLAICRMLDRREYDIRISGAAFSPDPDREVLDSGADAVCLGITAFTGYQIIDGLRLARKVREEHPALPIVWGGWHPTLEPKTTMESDFADIVVRGQGERTFAELVGVLAEGRLPDDVLGVSHKKNGRIIHNPDRPLEDTNNFPAMLYDVVDIEKVVSNSPFGDRAIEYVSSWGCPYRCSFCCERKVHGRKWSGLASDSMVDEIESLVNDHGINVIDLVDSDFFISEKRVKSFFEEVIRRKLDVKFCHVSGRVDQLLKYDDGMWELMVEGGLRSLNVGAESGFQKALDFMTKDFQVDDTVRFVEKVRRYPVKLFLCLVWGLPWSKDPKENADLLRQELDLNLDLSTQIMSLDRAASIELHVFTPYPGNSLYERSLELGLQPPATLEGWGQWIHELKTTPWVTDKQVERTLLARQCLNFMDSSAAQVATARIGNLLLRSVFPVLFRIYASIAGFRLKHKFLSWPIEYRPIRWARRRFGVG